MNNHKIQSKHKTGITTSRLSYDGLGKSLFDFVVSGASILVASPILLGAMASIYLEGKLNPEYKREIFFAQERGKKEGWKIKKLQTMKKGAEKQLNELIRKSYEDLLVKENKYKRNSLENLSLEEFEKTLKKENYYINGGIMNDPRIINILKIEDPRITPVGKHLRKTKIDELPQLYQVFTGAFKSHHSFSLGDRKPFHFVKSKFTMYF